MNVDRPADESFDDCEHVLKRVYEFLDNEIDAAAVTRFASTSQCVSPASTSSMLKRPSSRWSIDAVAARLHRVT